jgi:hypothetical protein
VAQAETLRGVWLLAEPVTLHPDESLVLTIVAEDLPSFRVSTTRFGALEPLEVASPSVLAALSAETRSPADESLLL